jgi:hypothetical protein
LLILIFVGGKVTGREFLPRNNERSALQHSTTLMKTKRLALTGVLISVFCLSNGMTISE